MMMKVCCESVCFAPLMSLSSLHHCINIKWMGYNPPLWQVITSPSLLRIFLILLLFASQSSPLLDGTNSEIFAVSVLIIWFYFHFRGTHPQTRGLGGYRGAQQAHHRRRGGALRRREGQGLDGERQVLSLQQIRGASGGWLSRGSHLCAESGNGFYNVSLP